MAYSLITIFPLQALERVNALIDHGDDVYANQIALIDADSAFHCIELLGDESEAVAVRAARVVARLTDHSAAAKARLQSGPTIGVDTTLTRVLLNPVQGDFVDGGAVQALVPWLFCSTEAKVDAALEALGALTSLHHGGKMAYLAALVESLRAGKVKALEPLDDLVDAGLESIDEEASRLLEGAIEPLVRMLRYPDVKAFQLQG